MRALDLLLVAAMVAAASAGNLLLKIGVGERNGVDAAWVAFLDWRLLSGLALFALSALLYLFLLRRMPLNVAQSLMALQFVAVIICSYVALHEPLPPLRLAGVIVITLGVVLVAISHTDGA